jgi:sulfur carrier protein ThiS
VDELVDSPQALATAVNQEFVARDARAACLLQPGDQVFTFQPITGG